MTAKLPKTAVDPVKNAGPIFLNVLDPDTIKEPVIIADPLMTSLGVIMVPEFDSMVPGSP